MKKWLIMVFGFVLMAGFVMEEAEARRLGGARSIGIQRQATPPQKPVQRQEQATPQQQNAAPGAAAAQNAARPGMGRWLAPLAGLAAGLGLAALFGEQMGSLVMLLLIGIGLFFLLRVMLRAMAGPAPQQRPVQYAGLGGDAAATQPAHVFGGSSAHVQPEPVARIPAGFDVEGFVREAKRQFVALQAANDRGDAEAIRDFVTDELYAELKRDIEARGGAAQQTDVVTLDAQLEEVVTEGGMHWATIRFSGMLREEGDGPATPFEELWHLQKPAAGDTGWLLAGIQQVH